jgi:hypothetical protein
MEMNPQGFLSQMGIETVWASKTTFSRFLRSSALEAVGVGSTVSVGDLDYFPLRWELVVIT